MGGGLPARHPQMFRRRGSPPLTPGRANSAGPPIDLAVSEARVAGARHRFGAGLEGLHRGQRWLSLPPTHGVLRVARRLCPSRSPGKGAPPPLPIPRLQRHMGLAHPPTLDMRVCEGCLPPSALLRTGPRAPRGKGAPAPLPIPRGGFGAEAGWDTAWRGDSLTWATWKPTLAAVNADHFGYGRSRALQRYLYRRSLRGARRPVAVEGAGGDEGCRAQGGAGGRRFRVVVHG